MPEIPSHPDNLSSRMRDIQVKDAQRGSSSTSSRKDHSKAVMDKLIADLKSQKQELENKGGSDSDVQKEEDRSSASEPFTPATESFDIISPADAKEANASNMSVAEMLRVKQELAAAQSVITRQEKELAESRNLKHTIDQAMGPASEADFGNRGDLNEEAIHHLQGAYNASAYNTSVRPFTARAESWHPQEDSRSDNSDGLPGGSYSRGGRGIWNGQNQPNYGGNLAQSLPQHNNPMDNRNPHGAWPAASGMHPGQGAVPLNQRVFSGPSVPSYGLEGRFIDDGSHYIPGGMRRTTSQYNRPSSSYNNRAAPFGGLGAGLGAGLTGLATSPMAALGYGGPLAYQPRPIGTPLSPTASEFNNTPLANVGNAWAQVSCCFPNATRF